MRDFIHAADGTTTLGDAVKYLQATRDDPVTSIEPQFEFNRFTRTWYGKHPSASRVDLLAAWNHYRSLPVDARGRA